MRYTLNISFKEYGVDNMVAQFKTKLMLDYYVEELVDDTVDEVLIKDNAKNTVSRFKVINGLMVRR